MPRCRSFLIPRDLIHGVSRRADHSVITAGPGCGLVTVKGCGEEPCGVFPMKTGEFTQT